MTTWSSQSAGTSLSTIVVTDDQQDEAILSHQLSSTQPPFLPDGGFWYDTTTGRLRVKRPGVSTPSVLLDPSAAAICSNGSIAMTNDLGMGGFTLTALGVGAAAGESVRYEQVVLADGTNPMSGDLAMGSNKITGLGAPSADADAARLVDISDLENHPQFQGLAYYQNSADARGNGYPVFIADSADVQPARITRIGDDDFQFVPRKVHFRFYGEWRLRSTNAVVGVTSAPDSATVYRYDGDPEGGDPGNGGVFQIAELGGVVRLLGNWTYAAGLRGFELFARRISDSADLVLRNPANPSQDGTIHVHAFGGILI